MTTLKARRSRAMKIVSFVVVLAVALTFTFVPAPAYAEGENGTFVFSVEETTTSAVQPSIIASFTGAPDTVAYSSVRLEELVAGQWTDSGSIYKYETSGNFDIYPSANDKVKGGVHTYRLFKDDVASNEISITVNKVKTTFDVGAINNIGTLYNGDYRYITNTVYYELKKTVSTTWPGASEINPIYIQKYSGGKWSNVITNTTFTSSSSPTNIYNLTLRQPTAATTPYRIYVPATDYVTGGYSAIFNLSGKKASPGLTVKYSGKQRYKKSGMSLNIYIKDKGAFEGKVYIYDGNKKIKTLKVLRGYIADKYGYYGKSNKYTLPKTLKKGTHKIKVKFVPSADYAKFYNSQTSSVKTVKAT